MAEIIRKMATTKPLSDYDIRRLAKIAPNFRDVFMRDTLPLKPWLNEAGVINLDSENGRGTHWVAYRKIADKVIYFDSFGDLPPPKEFIYYFRKTKTILYNYTRFQNFSETNCGQLCLRFLYMAEPFSLILKNI